jgi:GT2 family glycosyltransferase
MLAVLPQRPDFILAINDDSEFDENCLINLISGARTHKNSILGALLLRRDSPQVVYQCDPKWRLSLGRHEYPTDLTLDAIGQREPFEVQTVAGNCVLYPIEALDEVGLMDAKRFPQYGDVEYMARLKHAGWKILLHPKAHVRIEPNTDVVLSELPVKRALYHLFIKRASPHYYLHHWRQIYCIAPSRFQAVVGCAVFLARYISHACAKAAGRAFGALRPAKPRSI